MKNDEKVIAIDLRKNGISINEISKKIGVSKSTVSRWVKNIELTDEQKNNLGYKNGKKLTNNDTDKYRKIRIENQKIGKTKYINGDKRFAFGCALFWAEGAKSRRVSFCNTDVDMMIFFVNFLRDYFNVTNEKFRVSVNCYMGNGKTIDEIQMYWLNKLGLQSECLTKATIKNDYYPDASKTKHIYGVCRICVNSVELAQQIYGAIKEATGDVSNKWIDVEIE